MARRKGPSLTPQQVVAAAIEVVAADGPDAVGVSRVARALGIQPPSIYNHVGKGDALARAVVIECSRRLLDAQEQAVTGVDDPREQLRGLAVATRAWALANPHLYALMSRIEPDNEDPVWGPVIRDTLDLFRRPLGRLGVVGDDAVHAMRALRAAMHGFLLLESNGQLQLQVRSAESFQWTVDTLLRGLSP